MGVNDIADRLRGIAEEIENENLPTFMGYEMKESWEGSTYDGTVYRDEEGDVWLVLKDPEGDEHSMCLTGNDELAEQIYEAEDNGKFD